MSLQRMDADTAETVAGVVRLFTSRRAACLGRGGRRTCRVASTCWHWPST